MSSYATYQVNRIISDMTHIRSALADITRDEEKEYARITRANTSLETARSEFGISSFRRDIALSQQKLTILQGRREARALELDQKQHDLDAAQKALTDEQQRAGKKIHEIVTSLEPNVRTLDMRLAARTSTRLISQKQPDLLPAPPILSERRVRYNAFISHASEDKELARPLTDALRTLGHRIWSDQFTLRIGDSLRRTIDRGLSVSGFGIVILSTSFFAKTWAQMELNNMTERRVSGQKVILPIWHNLTQGETLPVDPIPETRLALNAASYTIQELARQIHEVLSQNETFSREASFV